MKDMTIDFECIGFDRASGPDVTVLTIAITEPRSWIERLFTWPWKPWETHKVVVHHIMPTKEPFANPWPEMLDERRYLLIEPPEEPLRLDCRGQIYPPPTQLQHKKPRKKR